MKLCVAGFQGKEIVSNEDLRRWVPSERARRRLVAAANVVILAHLAARPRPIVQVRLGLRRLQQNRILLQVASMPGEVRALSFCVLNMCICKLCFVSVCLWVQFPQANGQGRVRTSTTVLLAHEIYNL